MILVGSITKCVVLLGKAKSSHVSPEYCTCKVLSSLEIVLGKIMGPTLWWVNKLRWWPVDQKQSGFNCGVHPICGGRLAICGSYFFFLGVWGLISFF